MLRHTWLPASTANNTNALKIIQAKGSHLVLESGQQIYDGISSWWCKPIGHSHPLIKNSLIEQLNKFEHHIPANAYNDGIEQLSHKLVSMYTTMDKVMYASDGSCAIEMAMKLSYETRLLNNEAAKTKFIALNNAYHGETIFTLSVCGINEYKKAYSPFLCENYFIDNIPYVLSRNDPLWETYDNMQDIEIFIANVAHNTTALIIEPIVQGAAGLKIISKDFLKKLVGLARKYNIHVICDEIMVGLGRIGYSCVTAEVLNFEPEFVCVAKNLTAGSIPMSATIINKSISEIFSANNKLFPHSHTHSCNALATSVANGYLDYLESSGLNNQVLNTEHQLLIFFQELAIKYPFVSNPRAIGAIGACELNLDDENISRIFAIGIQYGIYIRPIGKTLYIMPPLYNITNDMIEIKHKLSLVLDNLM
ncbi:MAG: aminotransferase class III-fold pyridoxal phosphate-dependent enzyme [Proteobacteria bacterium]|jgi:adenosylmethionine-8-amino-7-oxononanoate aminotransferase|nr:aminotransferase class III-fold pyridoxal phosphate-dependent enzyme [Pseudomonadota bacterium]